MFQPAYSKEDAKAKREQSIQLSLPYVLDSRVQFVPLLADC